MLETLKATKLPPEHLSVFCQGQLQAQRTGNSFAKTHLMLNNKIEAKSRT